MSMPHSTCLRTTSLTDCGEQRLEFRLIERLAVIFRLHQIEQRMRPRQAADMGGLDAVGVLLDVHAVSSLIRSFCRSLKRPSQHERRSYTENDSERLSGVSCRRTASTSPSTQSSVILPSRTRKKAAPLQRISRPVGSTPKNFAAMAAVKAHPRCGAIRRLDHVVDDAGEILQRRMDRAQIGDKAARPTQFRTERAAKAKIGAENLRASASSAWFQTIS